jgi:hypothetical protein
MAKTMFFTRERTSFYVPKTICQSLCPVSAALSLRRRRRLKYLKKQTTMKSTPDNKTSTLKQRRYGVAPDPEHLPKLTVTQEDVDAAYTEVFGTEDEIRAVPVSAFINSDWSRLSDRYYRERVVHVLSNRTLLLRFDYDYEVDLDEINSEADLLHWTLHFREKVWMTTERLGCFIETVAAIKHLKVDA